MLLKMILYRYKALSAYIIHVLKVLSMPLETTEGRA